MISTQIIKINSQYAHSEIVQPALKLLSDEKYTGINNEFLKAHEHYRQGRFDDCISECCKTFESCLKIICSDKNWTFDTRDTAAKLIDIVIKNNLVPPFMKNSLIGISTIGNRTSRHGKGREQITVTEEMAAHAIHLTASNLLFLTSL